MSKSGLSPHIRYLIEDMRAEWRELDARIEAFDAELVAKTTPVAGSV